MQLYVAITDQHWYEYLSASRPDEVNFWRPSGTPFRALQPGELFLFKPHRQSFIIGGGFFSYFTTLPVSFAWKTFGTKNGAQTETEMRSRIEFYRRTPPQPAEDYNIGCILLQQPFFLARPDWFPLPDWNANIVQGRGYDIETQPGRELWERAMLAAHVAPNTLAAGEAVTTEKRFGEPHLITPRLGQASFRVVVADAYQRRCAFTDSPVFPTLEAAHIRPFALEGPHLPSNGLLLRQDLHTLFDRGYMTVTPEHRLEVSSRIHDEFENGREYYAMHGAPIRIPQRPQWQPNPVYLRWHNENVFRG